MLEVRDPKLEAKGKPKPARESAGGPSALRVLLVEDNPDHADLIRVHLSRGQEGGVSVQQADRLSDGLRMIDTGGFDAVLLDMMLPDSTGVETVSRFHAHSPQVPIVVLTSAEGEQYGIEAVHYGADDYIFKGKMDGQSLIRSIRYAIERSGRRKAEVALDFARQELRIAQTIQQGLYPRSAPPLHGFEIAGVSHPAESVGGDYFDYIQNPDGQIGLPIGDVSGHGIGPALLMAETRAALRTLGRTCHDPGEVLTLANKILLDGMLEGRFITLLLVSLNPKSRAVTWAGAGHPDGLIFDEKGEVVARLESGGCPLGVLPDEKYPASGPVQLKPGHLMLLYTDGVVEASPPGPTHAFGLDRLIKLIGDNLLKPAAEILEQIHLAVSRHTQPGKPDDDATTVVVKSL